MSLYVWNDGQLTMTPANVLLEETYDNAYSATPSHSMKEKISVDSDSIWYYEDGLNAADSESLRLAISQDSIVYTVETDYIPMKLITEDIWGGADDYIDFEYRGKIMLFSEEYYVDDIIGATKIYLSKVSDASQTIVLEDNEDIVVGGTVWDNWEVEFTVVSGDGTNGACDAMVGADPNGPDCDIPEYDAMDPDQDDALLQQITVTYDHKLDGVEALEKGESLEFPGGRFKLTFEGFLTNDFRESSCVGAGEGNIVVERGDEDYQIVVSFTGDDNNRYDDVRLDEGPFGKGNMFVIDGTVYTYDKSKDIDNTDGDDSDDQVKVTLDPVIRGNRQKIELDRLCDPEDEEGTALGCDFTTTFCDCEDILEEITVRTLALTDAMNDDDAEDMENDDEIEIGIEDLFYKENAIGENNLLMLYDGSSKTITFADDLTDLDITVNANMVGTLDEFDVDEHRLELWVEEEGDKYNDINSTNYDENFDQNDDGDDDDTLIYLQDDNGERVVIDLSDRDYDEDITWDYNNAVGMYEMECTYTPEGYVDVCTITEVITLDEDIDSLLITPSGDDEFTINWYMDNRINSVELCHPQDDVDATYFLGVVTTTTCSYSICGKDTTEYSSYPDYRFYNPTDTWVNCYGIAACCYSNYEYCSYGCSDGECLSATTTTIQGGLTVSVSPTSVAVGTATDVTVTVTNTFSAEAVGGATVSASGAGVSSVPGTTNANGIAMLSVTATSAGTITITVTKTGFTDATASVSATTTSTTSTTTTVASACTGDTNGDGTVSDFELLDAIDDWAYEQVTDDNMLITVDDWAIGCDGDCYSCGAAIPTVTRDLPDTIDISGTATVSLSVNVNEQNSPTGIIITESIPSGWTVTASSPEASSFTAATGEVKWILYGPTLITQTITYTVQVPADATGTATFTGVVKIRGSNDSIAGDTSVPISTETTTTTPTTTTPTTTTLPSADISITRDLPATAGVGSTVEVTLDLSLGTNKPNSVIIKEYMPDLNIISTSPTADIFNSTEIKWVLWGGDFYSRTLSYTFEANETGEITFDGEILYNWGGEITEGIAGDTQLSITASSVKGDTDGDGTVSDFELLSYIDSWASGDVGDFDLLEAIDNWSGGG